MRAGSSHSFSLMALCAYVGWSHSVPNIFFKSEGEHLQTWLGSPLVHSGTGILESRCPAPREDSHNVFKCTQKDAYLTVCSLLFLRKLLKFNQDDGVLGISTSVSVERFTLNLKRNLGLSKEPSWNAVGLRQVLLSVLDLSCHSRVGSTAGSLYLVCKSCPFPLGSSRFGRRTSRLQLISGYTCVFIPFISIGFQLQRNKWIQWTYKEEFILLCYELLTIHILVYPVFFDAKPSSHCLNREASVFIYFLTTVFNCRQFLIIYCLFKMGKRSPCSDKLHAEAKRKCCCTRIVTCR